MPEVDAQDWPPSVDAHRQRKGAQPVRQDEGLSEQEG